MWTAHAHGQSIRFPTYLNRAWWAVGTSEPSLAEWTKRPLLLEKSTFEATSNLRLWLRFPRARWADAVQAGFLEHHGLVETGSVRCRGLELRDSAARLREPDHPWSRRGARVCHLSPHPWWRRRNRRAWRVAHPRRMQGLRPATLLRRRRSCSTSLTRMPRTTFVASITRSSGYFLGEPAGSSAKSVRMPIRRRWTDAPASSRRRSTRTTLEQETTCTATSPRSTRAANMY